MTVHMYRLAFEPRGEEPYYVVRSSVDDWVSQYTHVLANQELSLTENQLDDGTPFFRGVWRFEMKHTEQNMTVDLQDRLDNDTEWSLIKYHACDHNDDSPSACSWDKTYEYGSVPSTVK